MRILVVEDYEPTRTAVAEGLGEEGFAVDAVSTGTEGDWMARTNTYDLIVLDVMLPGLDGLQILNGLRQRGAQTHVLMLTARDAIEERVRGLNLGADDYLVKPFAFAELLARVQALVRRSFQRKETVIRVEDLAIDTVARRVTRAGEEVRLSAREYALLELLAYRAGAIVTLTEIAEHLYEFGADNSSNVIDVFVSYLRRKIDRDGLRRLIQTRRGQGYVLGAEP